MFRFLDQRKRAKMRWVQDPSQSNVDNLNNVRHEVSDILGEKRRHILELELRKLKLKVRIKLLGTCIRASITLKRGTSLDVIQLKMRKVTWLQTPTVLWLGGGTISPSYSMCMGLRM